LAFLSAHSNDAVQALRTVLQWLSKQPAAQKLISEGAELPELNSLVGLANLRSALKSWHDNAENRDEEFWQSLFARHSYVLSQLFAYPVVLIKGKAYVGGKNLCNTGGNVVDFLLRTESSGAAVLVEIKTPQTPLLGTKYRDCAYPPNRTHPKTRRGFSSFHPSVPPAVVQLFAARTDAKSNLCRDATPPTSPDCRAEAKVSADEIRSSRGAALRLIRRIQMKPLLHPHPERVAHLIFFETHQQLP